jgi:hypothetical protein
VGRPNTPRQRYFLCHLTHMACKGAIPTLSATPKPSSTIRAYTVIDSVSPRTERNDFL